MRLTVNKNKYEWPLLDCKEVISCLPGESGVETAWANAAANVVGPTDVKWLLDGDGATPKPGRSEKSAMLSSPSENRDVSVIS